jgi:hypothetical protein
MIRHGYVALKESPRASVVQCYLNGVLQGNQMTRNVLIGAIIAALVSVTGCGYWPRSGNNGLFYTNTTAPVAVLATESDEPVKTGQACSIGVLGLWASGDSSVEAAKRNGGITRLATVEEKFKQVFLGVRTEYCTVVTGW